MFAEPQLAPDTQVDAGSPLADRRGIERQVHAGDQSLAVVQPLERRCAAEKIDVEHLRMLLQAAYYPEDTRIEPSTKHVQIVFDGVTVADTRNAKRLLERRPDAVVVLLSTCEDDALGLQCLRGGAAGFLSKDAVIESAYVGNHYAFWLLVVAAGFTSFYSWRLMFLTFYGTNRAHLSHGHGHGHDAQGHGHDAHGHDDHGHGHHEPHESPKVMLIPLGVLALGAVFSGMIWYNSFFGDEAKVRSWFGLPVAEHAATEGEADRKSVV